MLTHRRTHQTPHPSTSEIQHIASTVLGRGHLHRTRRQHHQPRPGKTLLSQPRADHCQNTRHRVGDLGVCGAERKHDGVRDGATVIQRGGQRGQIGITGHRNTRVAPLIGLGEHGPGRPEPPSSPGGGGGCGDPVEAEQAVPSRGVRGGQIRGRHRPQYQRLHLGHRNTRSVGDLQGDLARSHHGEPHPHRGRTDRRQRHTRPQERQRRSLADLVPQPQGVQHGVQQCRVQTEVGRITGQRLGQSRLYEQVLAVPPDLPQATERRTVDQATAGEPFVQALHRNLLRTDRRPHGQIPIAPTAPPEIRVPVACRIHGSSTAASSGRE